MGRLLLHDKVTLFSITGQPGHISDGANDSFTLAGHDLGIGVKEWVRVILVVIRFLRVHELE